MLFLVTYVISVFMEDLVVGLVTIVTLAVTLAKHIQ